MKRSHSTYSMVVVLTLISTLTGGVALATPASGILSGTVFARGPFVDPVDMKFKVAGEHREVLHVRNARETVVQQIVIGPLGQTGWHSHPGPVVVVIKSGALTFYSADDPACSSRTYYAGESFIDSGQGHVHLARNLSATENVELWATYFDVPVGQPFRIDAADPGTCNF
jgi:quercetin dioxygenase-like cupin family protein